MKPGKLCRRTGKRNYGSHEEAVRKAIEFQYPANLIRAYKCPFCKCWHITSHAAHERLSTPEDNLQLTTR